MKATKEFVHDLPPEDLEKFRPVFNAAEPALLAEIAKPLDLREENRLALKLDKMPIPV